MIGAVCLQLGENYRAEIYLAGTYSRIDWSVEFSCALGPQYSIYNYKSDPDQYPGLCIARGLDDELILRLKETRRYILKIYKDNDDRIVLPQFRNEGNKLLKCDKDRDSVTFQYVNYLGRSSVIFPDVGVTVPFEVVPEKMNYEDDYISLTESLAEECSELLLEYTGSTSNVFSQSDNDGKTLLEQFIFLRQFCYGQNIQSLIESIKRNPDRVLDQEEELKPVGMGRPSGRFYRNPFSFSRGWQKLSVHMTIKRLKWLAPCLNPLKLLYSASF